MIVVKRPVGNFRPGFSRNADRHRCSHVWRERKQIVINNAIVRGQRAPEDEPSPLPFFGFFLFGILFRVYQEKRLSPAAANAKMYKYLRERLLAQSLSLLPPFFLTVSRVPYSSQVPPGDAKNHALVYNEPSGLKAAPYIDSLMVTNFY